jgi:hypothetical protein
MIATILDRFLGGMFEDYDYDFSMFDDDEFQEEFKMSKEKMNNLLNRLKKFDIIQ